MKRALQYTLFALLALVPALSSGEEQLSEDAKKKIVEETIAKARAYLGSEAKLNSVTSIRYKGVIVYGNGDSGTVDIIFKKPNYQSITSVINGMKETSVLKRTEAWQKVERSNQPGAWELNLYEIGDILRMQANVRDQFDFMAVPSARVGKVTYEGEQEIEGVKTLALRYDHGSNIFFVHFVDPETGRIVRSINDLGMNFIRSGEKVVNGIKFPEKMVTRFQTPLGVQSLEVSYSSITLNEQFDDTLFEMPLLAE